MQGRDRLGHRFDLLRRDIQSTQRNIGFFLMTGALIFSETTPPGADRLVTSPLLLAGFVLTALGSIAGWIGASDEGDREPR